MADRDGTVDTETTVDLWQFLAVFVCVVGLLLSAAVAPVLGGVGVVDSNDRDDAGGADGATGDGDDGDGNSSGSSEEGESTGGSGAGGSGGSSDAPGGGSEQGESTDGSASKAGVGGSDEAPDANDSSGGPTDGDGGTSQTNGTPGDSEFSQDGGSTAEQPGDTGRITEERRDGTGDRERLGENGDAGNGQNGTSSGTDTENSGGSSGSAGQSTGQQDLEPPSGVGGGLSDEHQVGGPISESSFREAGSDVVLVSDLDRPVYWRLGAYDTYTGGQEWTREGSTERFSSETDPAGGDERLTQTVELHTQLRAVPGAWRITDVDAHAEREFERGDDGSVTATEPLEPGTTYTVVSHRQSADPQTLRSAGTDYDRELEERYTQVPEDTPRRVRTFTDDLTADDDSPYESAKTIERWIKENKTYDLGATHDPSEPMVDQFIFEMDGVYCDYAASAMVVMLRSQDVPARYVTGFSPGASVDGKQVVTQQNAHAWVEVYFPNEGWVRFDPTPPSDRQSTMQSSLDQDTLRDTAADFEGDTVESESDESGSGSETSDTQKGEQTPDSSSSTDEAETNEEDPVSQPDIRESPGEERLSDRLNPPYNVSLNRTYVPGDDVEITVQKSGVPIPNATVFLADQAVGETDGDGQVVATAPFTRRLTVTVVAPDRDDRPRESAGRLGPFPAEEGAVASLQPPSILAPQIENESQETNATFRTESDFRLAVTGTSTPGGSMDVAVRIDDRPVPNATVSLAGTRLATTDKDGTTTVPLPNETRTVTLRAERGDFADKHTIEIRELNLVVNSRFPLPGRSVDVMATHGEVPIDNATVTVDGDAVAETDNGTATVGLPLAPEAIVEVTYGGTTTSQTVPGLFRNASIIGVVLLLVATTVVRRRGIGIADVEHTVVTTKRRLMGCARWIISTAIRLAKRPVEATVWLARRLERLARRTGTFLRDLPDALRKSVSQVIQAITRHGLSVIILLNPIRILRWLNGVIRSIGSRVGTRMNQGTADAATSSSMGEPDEETRVTLRELWATFLDVVRPPQIRTMTPGEIRRYAVSRGFPADPVSQVVRAFRESEYGGVAPSSERVDQVQAALERLTADKADSDEVEEDFK